MGERLSVKTKHFAT